MIILSFVFFLLLFIAIGVISTKKSKNTDEDYLLAGRSISPALVGLSAMATNNSGYMFIGAIGYTYSKGLESFWVMFAWMLGDFLAGHFGHRKMREMSENNNSLSFGGLIGTWNGKSFKKVEILSGIITVVFLGAYAAAQFSAGGKALHVIFGWDYGVGAIIGSVIVLLYCLAGGIRASIWTDACQSVVMFFAMTLLLIVGVNESGGITTAIESLKDVSPTYLKLFPESIPWDNFAGYFFFVGGWVLGGMGSIGQPHLVTRFLTLDSPKNMKKARTYYYSFYFGFCILTFSVGLLARLLYPDITAFDPELVLPKMSMAYLPDLLVGLVLAGIFSASMSTADSQILSCSSAITYDIAQSKTHSLKNSKSATLAVTIGALSISLFGEKSVFSLVLSSSAVMAAAFAPVIMHYILGKKPNENSVLGTIFISVLSTLLWAKFGNSSLIYSGGIGMIVGMLCYFLPSKQ